MDHDSALSEALVAVTDGLDLTDTLNRILSMAVQLSQARYGALGVVGPDGRLTEFLHTGLAESEAERIGPLPTGHGLLGEVTQGGRPIRVQRMSEHPAASGFPTGHPPMQSFLGVPVVAHGRTFGRLYLTDKPGGFDAADEARLSTLAAAAGVAVENAQLFVSARIGEMHQAAVAAMSQAALQEDDAGAVLEALADGARRVAAADCAAVATLHSGIGTYSAAVPQPGAGSDAGAGVHVAGGVDAGSDAGSGSAGDSDSDSEGGCGSGSVIGAEVLGGAVPQPGSGSDPGALAPIAGGADPGAGERCDAESIGDAEAAVLIEVVESAPDLEVPGIAEALRGWIGQRVEGGPISSCLTEGAPVTVTDFVVGEDTVFRIAVCFPIGTAPEVFGALVLLWRRPAEPAHQLPREVVAALADHAATALALHDARREAQRLVVFQDRDRIARDLHDLVVQRLFASGMSLHVLERSDDLSPAGRDRVRRVIEDIDATIAQIRGTIFELQEGLENRRRFADRIEEEARLMADALGFRAEVRVSAELSNREYDELLADSVAVVREGLSNTARHAGAASARVSAEINDGQFQVVVADDGSGPRESARRSGLANLAARAEAHGGQCWLESGAESGSILVWQVPLARG